jgi:hypothetical protein
MRFTPLDTNEAGLHVRAHLLVCSCKRFTSGEKRRRFYQAYFLEEHGFFHIPLVSEIGPTIVDQNKVPTGEVEVADTREPKVSPIGLGGPWVKDECFDEV